MMYICCVLDGNIHIFITTQRDGHYEKKYRKLPFRLLTSRNLIAFTEKISADSTNHTCANMIRNMAATRIPCRLFSDPRVVVVSKRFLTFLLSENDRRYLYL